MDIQRLIKEATGATTEADVKAIEDTMREIVFGGDLARVSRSALVAGARNAKDIIDDYECLAPRGAADYTELHERIRSMLGKIVKDE